MHDSQRKVSHYESSEKYREDQFENKSATLEFVNVVVVLLFIFAEIVGKKQSAFALSMFRAEQK